MRGIKNSVVEKYSDQAHFIYELLQNADDAHAENARFILEENRLIFAHDGTRHFSVSDPQKEDNKNETRGDINAITSIANSNKTQEASIGKFGVGFKAVFQYTSTPHIYDPEFKFKIERFIVPKMLQGDFPGRNSGETVFVFPFDHPDKTVEESFSDISDKLQNLSFPLLFLSELKSISFRYGDTSGFYGKNINKRIVYDNTIAEQVCLTQNNGRKDINENLWIFSRSDEYERRYSVGFFMDQSGHLKPMVEPAFCFFPTKEVTGLNFILHAPFLLTDSREGIRAGIKYNDKMIQNLAELAADSLLLLKDIGKESSVRLIDDSILKIIPFDKDLFSDPENKRKVSFQPFFEEIKSVFKKSELLPSKDGYVSTENAYWASTPQIAKLFSDIQLADIVENNNARWVFVSVRRTDVQNTNKALFKYIEEITRTNLNEEAIIRGRNRGFYYDRVLGAKQEQEKIKGITPAFIEKQTIDWLHSFYKWLSETRNRTEIVTQKPIFLDQNSKAVAAFDKGKQSILFLPVEGIEGYTVVHPELLKNTDTKKFIAQIGIRQPSLKDQIYNIILPLYQKGGVIDTDSHFMMFFKYYCECSVYKANDFIKLIKNYSFLTYYVNGKKFRGRGVDLYFPDEELVEYFEVCKGKYFIAIDEYKSLVGADQEKKLMAFLDGLGVKNEIGIFSEEIDYKASKRTDLPNPRSTRKRTYSDTKIEGCEENLRYIEEKHSEEKSMLLWNCLLKIIETKCSKWKTIGTLLSGKVDYFYYHSMQDTFVSSTEMQLKKTKWLKNTDGLFVAPDEVYRNTLAEIYDTSSEYAEQLLDYLGIEEEAQKKEDDSNLTEIQKEKIAFADKLKEFGIENEEDLEAIREIIREFKRKKDAEKRVTEKPTERNAPAGSSSAGNILSVDQDMEDLFNGEESSLDTHSETLKAQETKKINKTTTEDIKDIARRTTDKPSERVKLPLYAEDDNDEDVLLSSAGKKKLNKTTSRVVKDIIKRTKDKPAAPELSDNPVDEDFDIDQDEYTPAPINYSRKIERAKQKSAAEIDKIAYIEELQARALEAPKYSYGWFTALLEMESINSGETNERSRKVSISFAKVEREPGTKRTLVLRHPNRYIPQFMEELADIPLILHMGDQTKTVAIEVANIKSYTLRVKMKNGVDIEGIDLDTVTSATIDTKSPAFLIEELRRQFAKLGEDNGYADDFNMQENLCENIEFVFGPPGTGKTTHLAKNVLLPMMQENTECKVLVLTPTNKSADVLVRRIMEVAPDTTYNNWLVRFGATGDEEIEQSPVFRDKIFDIRTLKKHITVTTIARFPYDCFMPAGARIFLNGINWDYIVIDEASMIPIANIVYPLYKKTPRKFIIAGDPFQIEPITSVDIWKNENIYTLVRLDSFVNPQTIPYDYKVELLTTQYRSVPDIGYVFSNFAYGGILQHYRSADSQRPLNVGNDLDIETLNIIKFPVSKYESIYRCKRLQHRSSYQVYSALFTFEYICYLSKAIAENNPGSKFNIGVIAPYSAQADMIDKLLASVKLPEGINVQAGTIHGFQGDECDIIFSVFNTPPSISSSPEMFLNKRNIINVSISRARDYLFIVMPDDDTENITNLHLVRKVESLMHGTDAWKEFLSPDLEALMFGDSKYLENNAFSTSHQSVNVYGLPEKCYEVRTEDSAIDVQIHRYVDSALNIESFASDVPGTKTSAFNKSGDLDENLISKELPIDAMDRSVREEVNVKTPFLMSEMEQIGRGGSVERSTEEILLTDDCIADFDMQLMDSFKKTDSRDLTDRQRIRNEYDRIKGDMKGRAPSRMDLFRRMDRDVYQICVIHASDNPFRQYLKYRDDAGDLSPEEREFCGTIGRNFISLIENTSMSKVYKMPVLMCFYNNGDIRMELTEEQLLKTWKDFFSTGDNWKDLGKDMTLEDYRKITDKVHIRNIMKNPVNFLKKSGKGFFIDKEGCAIALREELRELIGLPVFAEQMKDVIDYRTMDYYRRRYRERPNEEEVFIFEKKTDKSFFDYGMITIPVKQHKLILQSLGLNLKKGEKAAIDLWFNGKCYDETLKCLNVMKNKDVIQIGYKREIKEALSEQFVMDETFQIYVIGPGAVEIRKV